MNFIAGANRIPTWKSKPFNCCRYFNDDRRLWNKWPCIYIRREGIESSSTIDVVRRTKEPGWREKFMAIVRTGTFLQELFYFSFSRFIPFDSELCSFRFLQRIEISVACRCLPRVLFENAVFVEFSKREWLVVCFGCIGDVRFGIVADFED